MEEKYNRAEVVQQTWEAINEKMGKERLVKL